MGVITTIGDTKSCRNEYDILFLKEVILTNCGGSTVAPPIVEPEPEETLPPVTGNEELGFDYVRVDIDMVRKDTDVTSLDLVFIQDISGSFKDDLITVNSNLDSIMDSITDRISDTRFGLTTFSDIPDVDRGFGHEGDNPFTLALPLTSDKSALKRAYSTIILEIGGDVPESQLLALRETCLAPLGYRDNSKKVLFLLTDAPYHKNAEDSRYPTEESVIQAINELGAFTIFGVDRFSLGDRYEELRHALKGITTVIGSSSESLADALFEGLEASQESLKFPVSGKVYNALPGSTINIEAVDSTGKTINVSTELLSYGVFKAGTAFDGLSNGGIIFTITGTNKDNEEFTVVRAIYKY